MWSKDLKVFLDLSTYCNAACPQCIRTNPDGLEKSSFLPLVQWSLNTFKKAFPPSEAKNVAFWEICGTFGDPLMNKDIVEIVHYIVSNSTSTIMISTNGSMRDEEFFWDLGVLGGKQLQIIFAIDGIDQKMHSHYRRKTDLKKVLKHMEVLSQTEARVKSQTILFKHNEDYQDQIKSMAYKHGSSQHMFIVSDRFVNGEKFVFKDEDGKDQFFERADPTKLKNKTIMGSKYNSFEEQEEFIHCRWAQQNKVVVNVDGQVAPCCYTANPFFVWKERITDDPDNQTVMMNYLNNKDQYNIFKHKLSDIVKSKWFENDLASSFEKNPSPICVKNCSQKSKKVYFKGM